MDTLKMKFKLHTLEFEIEGKEAVVKEQFENFKEFVTGQLLSKINVMAPTVTTISSGQPFTKQINQPQDTTAIDLTDFPVLKEVVKKDIPKSEPEWVLIYCLYASAFGEHPFTEKDIRNKYKETNRDTKIRLNNITNNIRSALNKEYIKMQNDTEYIIKDKGIEYAKQILQGNTSAKSVSRLSKKSKPQTNKSDEKESEGKKTKSKSNPVAFIDLNLPAGEITAISKFFKEKNPKTQNEEVAVVMKWYKDNKKKNEISLSEINYLLSICSKVPSALEQVLINMKGAKFRWVANSDNGNVQLTSIGETYVTNKLPKKSE